jgi:hypothetical protein
VKYLSEASALPGVSQPTRPDISEPFVPDTFAPETGRLLFRDRRSSPPLGSRIEYFDQNDKQVKVRGHRIELGDINKIGHHPDVSRVHVILRRGILDDIRTVAYLTSARLPSQRRGIENLFASQTTEFMIPQRFMILAELPLLPNDEINLAALPQPANWQ